jgi:recombination protein RecT
MAAQNQTNQELAKKELTASERFMNMVVKEFNSGVGEVALTNFQKRLAQNYFISLDSVLKTAEEKRLKSKTKQGNEWVLKNDLPIVWQNINMNQLACDVVSAARVGLDPAQKNHVNLIPYKNNATNKYDVGFVDGYRGIELKAKKYGLDIPDSVTVELVYQNDKFKEIKKDRNNLVESYEFEIVNSFDRGEIVGGFYYHSFSGAPEKNKLVVFSLKDILKRKPKYASAEFWGGEKDKWEDGKKVGKETIEGWYDQMCYKTIYRAAFSDITIDSQKIDDDYLHLKQMERNLDEAKVDQEIAENANTETIDIDGKAHEDESVEPEVEQPTGTDDGPVF